MNDLSGDKFQNQADISCHDESSSEFDSFSSKESFNSISGSSKNSSSNSINSSNRRGSVCSNSSSEDEQDILTFAIDQNQQQHNEEAILSDWLGEQPEQPHPQQQQHSQQQESYEGRSIVQGGNSTVFFEEISELLSDEPSWCESTNQNWSHQTYRTDEETPSYTQQAPQAPAQTSYGYPQQQAFQNELLESNANAALLSSPPVSHQSILYVNEPSVAVINQPVLIFPLNEQQEQRQSSMFTSQSVGQQQQSMSESRANLERAGWEFVQQDQPQTVQEQPELTMRSGANELSSIFRTMSMESFFDFLGESPSPPTANEMQVMQEGEHSRTTTTTPMLQETNTQVNQLQSQRPPPVVLGTKLADSPNDVMSLLELPTTDINNMERVQLEPLSLPNTHVNQNVESSCQSSAISTLYDLFDEVQMESDPVSGPMTTTASQQPALYQSMSSSSSMDNITDALSKSNSSDCYQMEDSNGSQRSSLAESSSTHSEKKRSRICEICSMDSGNYNMNYGANSCLGCRAFFRRAIQSQRKIKWKCKTGNSDCHISYTKRNNCKRCRFEKCLRAGMNSERVLDKPGFKQRFKKMLSKQDSSKSSSQTSETDEGTSSSSTATTTTTTATKTRKNSTKKKTCQTGENKKKGRTTSNKKSKTHPVTLTLRK